MLGPIPQRTRSKYRGPEMARSVTTDRHGKGPRSSSHGDASTQRTLDDPALAERIRVSDPSALQSVARAYLGQVFRAARGAGLSPEQAEDVTQATFTTFIERAAEFEGRSHVRTWIFGILYRKIAEARRRRDRDRDAVHHDDVFESRFDQTGGWSRPPGPADADVQNREIREAISECLDAAPTQQRVAFVFREVEGLSSQEICNILQVTNTNLRVMLHRIRNRLRECLENMGIDRAEG